MEHVFQFAIAVGILVVQFFVSKRGPVLAGAVFPIIYIGFFIYGYSTHFFNGTLGDILAAGIGGTVLLLGAWIKGRESFARQRQRELTKMKAMDL